MTVALVCALPWLGLLVWVHFGVRKPTELPPPPETPPGPLVSVIVPARDEAANIDTCVRSLTASRHPAFEIIVVDDRSEDGTASIVRGLDAGSARSLSLVEGEELPAGWLGKPWACRQGVASANGSLLLFTDADTVHGPDLLTRAVAGLREEEADLLTVMGRQLMETFWERLVQPQIFLLMLLRFPDVERAVKSGPWREAIANGQFLLFRREAYEAIGGHEAVRDEVAEDLALAQRVKRAGLRLRVRGAESDFGTRMYRSLGQLVEGWSKNIVLGGLQTMPPWARHLLPLASLSAGVGLWLVPPALLAAALVGFGGAGIAAWAGSTYGMSVLLWAGFSRRMGAPARYGLLYPLGALVGAFIFARSWSRGRRVVWKGRRYELPAPSERA